MKYRRGEFGVYHNYAYSMKCVPFDDTYKEQPTTAKWCSNGLKDVRFRTLCECNQTQINYFTEEPDLDNWKR